MANILGLDTSKVYFHGVETGNKGWKLRNPSIKTPMYLTPSYEEASSYCYDIDDEIVYLVTIKDGTKAFNFANGKHVDSLRGKTFYADDTIDLLRKCYGQIEDFNLWVWSHKDDEMIAGMFGEIRVAIQMIAGNYDLKWGVFENGSPFFHVIHHYSAEGSLNKIRPEDRKDCEDIRKVCEEHGFKTIHEAVFSKAEDADNEVTLMMKMYCDVMDAMATGMYKFDFMTFRRPLYEAILGMGYTVVCDSSTTGRWADEYVVLSPEPIDRILNVPMSEETERKYEVVADMRYTLKSEDSMTKENLQLFLDSTEDKL